MVRQVLELERMTAAELRKVYNNLFELSCSDNANKEQLIPKIAYRIQESAFGGLSQSTKAKLDLIAKAEGTTLNKHCNLLTGTKICKEYNGIMHSIEVLKDGFEYNGQKWKSLSAIATKITGTKWNGPKFFNLRG